MRCGLAAPSSKAARPWQFHVVTAGELIEAAAHAMLTAEAADSYVPFDPLTGRIRPDLPSTVRESATLLLTTPAAIFIINRGPFSRGRATLLEAIRERRIESLVAYTFEVVGIGAALENMWLAAHSLGLVATFLGDVVVAEGVVVEALGIEGDLVGVLALGHPLGTEETGSPERAFSADMVTWHERPV